MLPLAAQFDCAIAGGDVNSWSGPLAISVTALGEVQPGREWRRSGARPGDQILVTGSFGGSILGKQFTFTPRVSEALWLAEHLEVHAAIDVSDGLSLDLSRLAEASGVGACLDPDRVPISEAARQLSGSDGRSPLDHALGDGEDFELIFAVSQASAERFFVEHPNWRGRLTAIGQFVVQKGLWLQDDAGMQPLPPRGYQHRLDS
jgi:thiamine-monophosphate kinase